MDLTNISPRDLADEHRRLALEHYGDNPPAWLHDDGQWTMIADSWATQYFSLDHNAQAMNISYKEQLTALRWAYQCRDTWGQGMTWARVLSGRQGARVFADKALSILDRIDSDTMRERNTQPSDRHFHRASRKFLVNYTAIQPKKSDRIVETEARLTDALERYPEYVRARPEHRQKYIDGIYTYLMANCQAHAAHVRSKSGAPLGGVDFAEPFARRAAKELVKAMVRGEKFHVKRVLRGLDEWHKNGCGGMEPTMGMGMGTGTERS